MTAIFISYRRKDTVDVVGRIFDRLAGYFGPGSVLLDVDALVAGSNYRTQIEQLLSRCSVVLAVIGREWLTVADDSGRRRLDNPDDQLRIEIAVALASGKTVIPVLVHDAKLPAADQLPADLAGLAACDPHHVQSGAPFNTDMPLLIERLEAAGVTPPETTFPWQYVLLAVGIGAVLAALGTAVAGPGSRINDYFLQQLAPTTTIDQLRTINDFDKWDGGLFDRARFDRETIRTLFSTVLPLTIGPLLIVWGKRICCLSKERTSARRHYAQGAGRLPTPKSGKSILCLALGAASIGAGVVTAIPALIVGAVAWRELRVHPTWIRGRSLVVFGSLSACAGLLMFALVHLNTWRMRSWLTAAESASAAQQAGDATAEIAALDRAMSLVTRGARQSAVTLVRRAEALIGNGQAAEAVKDLTAAIDMIEADVEETNFLNLDYNNPIWQAARTARAQAFETLGRQDEAAEDRQASEQGLNYTYPTLEDPPDEGIEDAPDSRVEEAPPAPPPTPPSA